jgi:hypothetical protein
VRCCSSPSSRHAHPPLPVGTAEDVDKLNRRQVKVTREHNEECRKLLTLMGIPWVEVRPPFASPRFAKLIPSSPTGSFRG